MRVFFFFLLSPALLGAQQKFFSLHDGELDSGSIMRCYDILFDFNKATLRPEDSVPLKEITSWIILHPEFNLEVGNHTDYVNPNSSFRLTPARAKTVMEWLVKNGVPPAQLSFKGYGEIQKVIPTAQILKEPNKGKQDSLKALNRRTEFRIIKVNPHKMHSWYFTDSLFWPGEIMRLHSQIEFDFDKASIRPDSKLFLDTVALFLQSHPNVAIEVGSHTDQRGSDPYNLKLSESRAKCVADYLISKGIDPKRLRAKGFGETQPLYDQVAINYEEVKEKREEMYQQNRRTELKIISVQ